MRRAVITARRDLLRRDSCGVAGTTILGRAFPARTAGRARLPSTLIFPLLRRPFEATTRIFRLGHWDRAGGPMGFARLRLTLLLERLSLPADQLVKTPALHLRVEHFQGSAAGVDLVVMGEIGEAFVNRRRTRTPPDFALSL